MLKKDSIKKQVNYKKHTIMTKFNQLKPKQVLSEAQFYVVEKVVGNEAQLKPAVGPSIVVPKEYIEEFLLSANQFDKEEKVTRTDASTIFVTNSNVAITVNFNKQVKEKEVTEEIMKAYESSTVKTMEVSVKKAVKKALEGEERTMVGKHSGSVDEFGRIHFIDMEVVTGNNQRLVDPRTINWLIVKGVKYIVK